jgi:pimeloyl-ACP methyl ester carboxylesterase
VSRSTLFTLSVVTALAAALFAAVYASHRTAVDKLGFYLWKAISRDARRGQYLSINNIRIYFETYGRGQPVLLLHGGLGSIDDMHYQIRALAKKRLVVAADSRAHGRSTDSDVPLSYELMADDMVKLLDNLKIDQVEVVGWSDGGIIGLDLAMRHPDRIKRLVAIGASYDVDGLIEKPSLGAEIPPAPGFYLRNAPDPDHWPVLYRKAVTMWQTQPHYTLDDLAKIKAPTLLIAGQFDVIKREHVERLAKAIHGSQEDIIEGGTHSVPFDQPDIVNAHILRFLDTETP